MDNLQTNKLLIVLDAIKGDGLLLNPEFQP